jgi:hypothetical protein
MRTAPSGIVANGTDYYNSQTNGTSDYVNSFGARWTSNNATELLNNSQAAGTGGDSSSIITANAAASIAFSAEL